MTAPRRNLELKCRCADLSATRAALCHLGAISGGLEIQVDTYFRAPHGRLKLREINAATAVLIGYVRPDEGHYRASSYHLAPVPEPGPLKAALAGALGVRGAVRKRREIYLWHNVRIHLDEVDGLGTFVELEAVLSPLDDEGVSRARLDRLCSALAIDPAAGLAPSYADLLGV
jgi:adenylate cyclase class IV